MKNDYIKHYYPTALRIVQITPKRSTNIRGICTTEDQLDKFAAVDQLVGFPAPIPFRSAYFCHAFLVNKYPRNSSDDKSLIRRFVV